MFTYNEKGYFNDCDNNLLLELFVNSFQGDSLKFCDLEKRAAVRAYAEVIGGMFFCKKNKLTVKPSDFKRVEKMLRLVVEKIIDDFTKLKQTQRIVDTIICLRRRFLPCILSPSSVSLLMRSVK